MKGSVRSDEGPCNEGRSNGHESNEIHLMERRMMENYHVRCGLRERPEMFLKSPRNGVVNVYAIA